jgi:glutamate-1-semialdehyde 2,1-aminomutase
MINRERLAALLDRERKAFQNEHPRSKAAYDNATHLFGRVPMTWMNKTAAGFPIYLDSARGATVRDVDGHTYTDFSLGDTAAMAGHSPQPVVDAVHDRFGDKGGASAMLPTEEATAVGRELSRRFGPTHWSFTLTATDANRWAIRLLRALTGRPKILFNSYCYHGSVDESLIVIDEHGQPASREGNVGAPTDVTTTSRVADFNDLETLERELNNRDVAAVLMEPALTNIGIVLPEPGYLDGVRELTRATGTYLINDETHTFCAGPGGATRLWNLQPDVVTIGKAIGGGIPAGAYGLSDEVAAALGTRGDLDLIDMGGVGGTLAGNALSVAAMRATFEHVLTDAAFEHMTALGAAFAEGVLKSARDRGLPWSVSRLGARAELRFASPAPRTGTEANRAGDADLDDYLHVYLANRGILLTPFHNMALMSPATTADQVAHYELVFRQALDEL